MITIYNPLDPPVATAVTVLHELLAVYPRRIAFAGFSGSGKSTLADLVAGRSEALLADPAWTRRTLLPLPLPVFNHADGIKEEVLEWVSVARTRALMPGDDATFRYFCDFVGISPAIVRSDMWEVLGPTWLAMNALLVEVYERKIPVQEWAGALPRSRVEEKVAFVDAHKALFRRSLQRYGQAIREIGASPGHWAETTVQRGFPHPLCLNADTRFPEEVQILRGCGWTVVWLEAAPATLAARNPAMTWRDHASEQHNLRKLADCTLNADQPTGKILMDFAEWITSRGSVAARKRTRTAAR